jgi:hypothetical protein
LRKNVSPKKDIVIETILFVQISIQQNSTCSAWIDTADLVQAQDLDVFDEDGNAAHEAYLDILEELKAKDTYCGKCVKILFTTLIKNRQQ